jgi:glyoxylase-like metal-dependent hydrolase (beta-lactamase superfamily II)
MGFINSEGRFNQNTYLIDGELYRMKGNIALYVVENEGMRMMIDVGEALMAKKVLRKLVDLDLYPIHKILLTHSHFDHVQGVGKLKKLMKDTEIEILASEKAIDNLKNPEKMNKDLGYIVDPIENVTPLKEGDIIDLNGLKLEIFNFFGHTQDSIAALDRKNKNIFVGDAIMDKFDQNTFLPEFVPPDFMETTYLKTIQKIRNLKNDLKSLSLAHFGVWTDNDCQKIINDVENFHMDAKNSIIKWFNENPSVNYVTLKYHEKFIPDSKIHTKENIFGLQVVIEWLIKGLKKIKAIN